MKVGMDPSLGFSNSNAIQTRFAYRVLCLHFAQGGRRGSRYPAEELKVFRDALGAAQLRIAYLCVAAP